MSSIWIVFLSLALAQTPKAPRTGQQAVQGPARAAAPAAPVARPYESPTCSEVDLRPQFQAAGMPQESVQGPSTGWCYSFVAAEVLSFEAKKHLSAADLAVRFIHENREEMLARPPLGIQYAMPLGGGAVDRALQVGLSQGVCLENERPSVDLERLRLIEQRQMLSRNSLVKVQRPREALRAYEPSTLSRFHQDLHVLLDRVADNTLRDLLNRGFSKDCRPVVISGRRVQSESRRGPQDSVQPLYELLDRALDAARPAAIGYDATILTRPPQQLVSISIGHASLVVGRRKNSQNRCEYLIRNTETGCALYRDNLKAHCENNHVWVPAADLAIVLGSVEILD